MTLKVTILQVLLALALASLGPAKDYGIFVDGGYGKGQPKLNELVDQRIDEAKRVFDERHPDPGGESMRVEDQTAFKDYLTAIPCMAGDSITIVMMGHGKQDSFKFSLANSNKTLTARELTDCLKAKHPECCIRVVIFACHSGSFIDNLFQSPNVKAVYTSCKAGEKSYTDAIFTTDGSLEDHGDWMRGFNEDWDAVAPGTDEGDALDMATESAWAKIPNAFGGKQTPAGWRRGDQPVLAHVERRFDGRSSKAKLHFYNPVFMRCQTAEVKIDKDNANISKRYEDCDWIRFTGRFGTPKADGKPKDQIVLTDPPSDASPPQEMVVAHIEGGGRSGGKRHLKVHLLEPNWLLCTRRTLWLNEGVTVNDQLRRCSFIKQNVSVDDPTAGGAISTGEDVAPFTWITPVVAHVERVENHRGRICVTIRHPEHLRFLTPTASKPIYIPVGAAQRATLERCDDIRVELHLRQLGGDTYTGTNLREIDKLKQSQVGSFDAGIEHIVAPGFAAPLGEPLYPAVEVRNAGSEDLGGSQVTATILDPGGFPVFEETLAVDPLPYDRSQVVNFSPWFPELPGDYRAVFSTTLPADQNPANDLQFLDFVVPPPAPTAPVPDGWRSILVGDDFAQPFFQTQDDALFLEAFGNGVGPTGDQLSFVFQEMAGDFAVSSMLASGQLPPDQVAYLMVRGGPAPDAPFAALVLNQNQVQFVVRPNAGAPPNSLANQAVTGPVWLGLVRQGNVVRAELSPDGVGFDPLGAHDFQGAMPDPALVGLGGAAAGFGPAIAFLEAGGFPTGPAPDNRPVDLTASGLDQTTIALNWSDRSLTEFGFLIERAEGDGPFAQIAMPPPNATSHLDGGLSPATTYTYRVRKVGLFESEDWSPAASAETHGPGLATWAAAHGIDDPFADLLGDGTPAILSYASGRDPDLFEPPTLRFPGLDPDLGLPLVDFEKAPGIHDVRVEVQLLDEAFEWDTIHALEATDPAGRYQFVAPFTLDGNAILRFRLTETPLGFPAR